jgi:hypothetical protein
MKCIKKMKGFENKDSDVMKFRKQWLKKGIDLINITTLCEPKMGCSGWCGNFNEPDETIHHIQIHYRNEPIANIKTDGVYIIDDSKYVAFITNEKDITGADFCLFRKVPIKKVKINDKTI